MCSFQARYAVEKTNGCLVDVGTKIVDCDVADVIDTIPFGVSCILRKENVELSVTCKKPSKWTIPLLPVCSCRFIYSAYAVLYNSILDVYIITLHTTSCLGVFTF